MPVSGMAVINAAATSPSVIRRMRAPRRRTSAISFSCRGRSRMMTVRSFTSMPLARATAFRFSSTGALMSMTSRASGPTAILSMYTNGPGLNMVPRGASATVEIELYNPFASGRVPSMGSTAISTWGGSPLPRCSPLKSMGASSFSPSPMTMMPSISTSFSTNRMASTEALSAAILSPRPIKRPAASAAASVTRTRSSARLRVGFEWIISPPSG